MGITRTSLDDLHIRLQQYIVLQLQQLLLEGIHHLECGVHDEVKQTLYEQTGVCRCAQARVGLSEACRNGTCEIDTIGWEDGNHCAYVKEYD